ncbi:MAG: 30S ribosomal protein S5 [Planctomycetota bacterium]|nr:30S ribosomal protein S5 [Planctomycetota bacterium]
MSEETQGAPSGEQQEQPRRGRGPRRGGGPGGDRGRRSRDPQPEERAEGELVDKLVAINRVAKVVKGGRRFSFSALVVVGDGKGRVGIGYGKANGVPNAVEKGVKDARKHMFRIPLVDGTIPHPFKGEYRASAVIFEPASPGTGIIAGASVRAVCEAAGIRNILTKCHGSGNPLNVVKACEMALKSLRTRDQVERLRGVKLDPAAGTWRMKALKASEGGTPRAEKEAAVQ